MTKCKNCNSELAMIETGTFIISTCRICSVEFDDVNEITKEGRYKSCKPNLIYIRQRGIKKIRNDHIKESFIRTQKTYTECI